MTLNSYICHSPRQNSLLNYVDNELTGNLLKALTKSKSSLAPFQAPSHLTPSPALIVASVLISAPTLNISRFTSPTSIHA